MEKGNGKWKKKSKQGLSSIVQNVCAKIMENKAKKHLSASDWGRRQSGTEWNSYKS